MEYVYQCVMHSWVAMFRHTEAPRDCIDVDELSLLLCTSILANCMNKPRGAALIRIAMLQRATFLLQFCKILPEFYRFSKLLFFYYYFSTTPSLNLCQIFYFAIFFYSVSSIYHSCHSPSFQLILALFVYVL